MIVRERADTLEIYGDDSGFHLKVEDADGTSYDFRIHGAAWEFARSPGLQALLAWRDEGEAVMQERSAQDRAVVKAGMDDEDYGDDDGYEPTDPKSAFYVETIAALADRQRKQAKGE